MKKNNTFYFNMFVIRPCQIIALIFLLVSFIGDYNVLIADIRNTIIVVIFIGALEFGVRCSDD